MKMKNNRHEQTNINSSSNNNNNKRDRGALRFVLNKMKKKKKKKKVEEETEDKRWTCASSNTSFLHFMKKKNLNALHLLYTVLLWPFWMPCCRPQWATKYTRWLSGQMYLRASRIVDLIHPQVIFTFLFTLLSITILLLGIERWNRKLGILCLTLNYGCNGHNLFCSHFRIVRCTLIHNVNVSF